jgi:hypothetical protein
LIVLICEVCGRSFELNRAFVNGFVPEICKECRKQRQSQ